MTRPTAGARARASAAGMPVGPGDRAHQRHRRPRRNGMEQTRPIVEVVTRGRSARRRPRRRPRGSSRGSPTARASRTRAAWSAGRPGIRSRARRPTAIGSRRFTTRLPLSMTSMRSERGLGEPLDPALPAWARASWFPGGGELGGGVEAEAAGRLGAGAASRRHGPEPPREGRGPARRARRAAARRPRPTAALGHQAQDLVERIGGHQHHPRKYRGPASSRISSLCDAASMSRSPRSRARRISSLAASRRSTGPVAPAGRSNEVGRGLRLGDDHDGRRGGGRRVGAAGAAGSDGGRHGRGRGIAGRRARPAAPA